MSPISKKILRKVPYPLDVTYFVSPPEAMPSHLKQIEREVIDRLEEFAATSDKIRFQVKRIENAKSKEAQELSRRGVIPFTVRTVSRDAFQVTKVYSALTVSYLDRLQKALPQVTPETLQWMEYRLMASVLKIQREKTPYISLYGEIDIPDKRYMTPQLQQAFLRLGSKMPQIKDRYDRAAETIREDGYRFERISLMKEKAPVPKQTDCLVVLGPESLAPKQVKAIRDFLASNKSVILALQNQTYEYQPGGGGGLYVRAIRKSHGLDGFLDEIGTPLSQKVLMDEAQQTVRLTRRVNVQGHAGARIRVPVKLPIQVLVSRDQINRDLAMTEGISRLFYLWGNALRPDDNRLKSHDLKLISLFTSSNRSWEAEAEEGGLSAEYFAPPKVRTPRLPLAVMVEGDFSWLAEDPGKSTDAVTEKNEKKHGQGRLLVIGSGEMFKKGVLDQGQNRLLLLNILDTLTLGGELLPLRAKAQAMRYIRQADDKEKVGARLFGVVLMPLMAGLFGVARFTLRRRRRSGYTQKSRLKEVKT